MESGHHTASLIHFDEDGWHLSEESGEDYLNPKGQCTFDLDVKVNDWNVEPPEELQLDYLVKNQVQWMSPHELEAAKKLQPKVVSHLREEIILGAEVPLRRKHEVLAFFGIDPLPI